MLPFLKNQQKSVSGVIIEKRKAKDGSLETNPDSAASQDYGIESCAEALMRGINNKDAKAVAQALKDAFDILESQPHEEGQHTNEEENQ